MEASHLGLDEAEVVDEVDPLAAREQLGVLQLVPHVLVVRRVLVVQVVERCLVLPQRDVDLLNVAELGAE